MSENAKKAAELILANYDKLSEFDKGYFVAKAESAAEAAAKEEKEVANEE